MRRCGFRPPHTRWVPSSAAETTERASSPSGQSPTAGRRDGLGDARCPRRADVGRVGSTALPCARARSATPASHRESTPTRRIAVRHGPEQTEGARPPDQGPCGAYRQRSRARPGGGRPPRNPLRCPTGRPPVPADPHTGSRDRCGVGMRAPLLYVPRGRLVRGVMKGRNFGDDGLAACLGKGVRPPSPRGGQGRA